jgi:hypothetical protein
LQIFGLVGLFGRWSGDLFLQAGEHIGGASRIDYFYFVFNCESQNLTASFTDLSGRQSQGK